ncbi:hypothetical protein ACNAW0_00255 [Micromonospora sp. SL1-18]|uniref:hypothetical protein n=1 Tax=Micromonospora sp. SL1-18 TaxID=3399128 RepID=UPI003A4DB078
MTTELRVTLPGPEGSADARRALAVLDRFLSLLGHLEDNALDKRASRADERSTWGITAVQLGSLVTTLAPNRLKRGATTNTLDRVAGAAVNGLAEAEEREGLPRGWDTKAAAMGAELAHMLGLLAVDGMVVELLDRGRVVRDVTITRHAAEHLVAALKVRRQSIGSVIGRLDAISVHQRREAGLWHERTGERITVTFAAAQTDEISSALGHRVEIAGRITRDIDDRLISIKVRSLERLPDHGEGPPVTDLFGIDPDLTGGMDPTDYLGEIRGAS